MRLGGPRVCLRAVDAAVSGARPARRWWRTSGRQRPRVLGVPRTVPRTGGRCLWPAQGHRRRTAPVRRAPETVRDSGAHNAQLLRSQRLDGVIYLSGAGASPSALLELTKLGPVVLVDEQVPGFDLPSVVS